jgi:hypothetical protein
VLRARLIALALAAGCGANHHDFSIVPSLTATCAVLPAVNEVELSALGDFPLSPQAIGAASMGAPGHLALPAGTREIAVEGFGPGGLAAFGRTGPIDPSTLSCTVAIAYGPPDGVMCTTGAMVSARAGHRATLLPSGNVLLSGGANADGFAVTALELYVPGGDAAAPAATFRPFDPHGAAMLDPGAALGHAVAVMAGDAIVISGGAPVVAGVADGVGRMSLQVFTADGAPSGPALALERSRAFHSATVLDDGRLLLVGGCELMQAGACVAGHELASTEIFDPTTGKSVDPMIPLKHARWDHDAFLRGDGSIVLVGGHGPGGVTPPIEIYDPLEARGVDVGQGAGRAALLATGGVLFAGGAGAPAAEAGVWLSADEQIALASLPLALAGQTVTALDDGSVLVAGGTGSTGALAQAAPLTLYDALGRPTTLAAAFARRDHTATRLADGTVLLAGGADPAGASAVNTASIYFRTPLGPFSSLSTLVLDAAEPPVQPRRADHARIANAQLQLSAAQAGDGGRPGDFALVAGVRFADVTFDVAAGRLGPTGAALIVGFESEASYAFVSLEPGQPVTLAIVSAPVVGQSRVDPEPTCVGAMAADANLPDGKTAPLELSWRLGVLTLTAGEQTLLHCAPRMTLPRGAVGVAVLHGDAVFERLTLTR